MTRRSARSLLATLVLVSFPLVGGCGDDADDPVGADVGGATTVGSTVPADVDEPPSAPPDPTGATPSETTTTAAVDTTAAPATSPGTTTVVLAFWPESALDLSDGAPPVPDPALEPPRQELEFVWDDPSECVTWERRVATSAGGGTRVNTASDFVVDVDVDGDAWVFDYVQNDARCSDEFARPGTAKTFRSDVLTLDESTGQTGDPLWVGVVEVVDATTD